jgi:hypothetical protein
MAGEHQLRGWKEIAAFLGASVRSAMRWEGERGLPVRRLPGGAKDSVFAYRHELEIWQRSDPARTDAEAALALHPGDRGGDEPEAPGAIPDVFDALPLQGHRRWFLAAASTLVLVGLAIGAVWVMGWPHRARPQQVPDSPHPATGARATAEPAPVILPLVQLDISRPDGWKTSVRVPDGGAAQIGGSPGHPVLILRPRLVPAGLMLEVARADGQPLKDQGRASQPLVLLLERGVTVQLRQPSPLWIRWPGGETP